MTAPKPSRVKSVLHDCTVVVKGAKNHPELPYMDSVEIKMTIKVNELDYGPCLDWSLTVDVPCEKGWAWDDHPLLHCRARKSEEPLSRPHGSRLAAAEDSDEPVSKVGEILDDTPAVRAMLAELCSVQEKKLYTGTDCTHRARLIAALEMFWS